MILAAALTTFVCLFQVPGNFHLATHSSREKPIQPNMQHVIEYVAFGDDVPQVSDLRHSLSTLNLSSNSVVSVLLSSEFVSCSLSSATPCNGFWVYFLCPFDYHSDYCRQGSISVIDIQLLLLV